MPARGCRLSPQALSDFRAIADDLREQSPMAAVRVLTALQETFELLQRFPEMGQKRDDLHPGVRVIVPARPAHRYAIFYYVTVDEIQISDVIHSARDWEGMFQRGER